MGDTEEIIALRLKVKEGREAARELKQIANETQGVGDKTEKSGKKAQVAATRWERAQRSLKSMSTQAKLGVVAIGAMGGYAVRQAVNTTEDLAKSVMKLTSVTAMDVRESARWSELAAIRGIDNNALNLGFVALSKNLEKATLRGSKVSNMFRDLGVRQAMIKRGNLTEIILQMAEGFKKLGPGPERNAIGAALLSRSYLKLIPLLKGGKKGLEENLDSVNAVGDAFAEVGTGGVTDFIKSQRKAEINADALRVTIGLKLIPVLNVFFSKLGDGIKWLLKHKTVLMLVVTSVITLTVAMMALSIAVTIMGAVAAGISAPFIAIAAVVLIVIVALVTLYARVRWFRKAVNSAISFVARHWKTVVASLVAVVLGPLAGLVLLVALNFRKIVKVVKSVGKAIGRAAKGMWDGIKWAFKSVINWIIGKWNGLRLTIGPVKIPFAPDIPRISVGVPPIPKLGVGGTLLTSGPVDVGERGRERLWLPRGTQVEPLNMSDRLAAGIGRGDDAPIEIPVYLDGKEIARSTARVKSDREARGRRRR